MKASIFKQLSVAINAAEHEIHHTVLPINNCIHCVCSCAFQSLNSLSGLSDECIENNIFIENSNNCAVIVFACRITWQKQNAMALYIGTSPGWKNQTFSNKEFRLQFHFCRHVVKSRW